MSLKMKLMSSLMTIGLVSALIGGATFAQFTATASNANNTFKAGTLVVAAGQQQYNVNLDNLKPGETVSGSFTVSNTGTLPLNYTVSPTTSGNLFTFDDNHAYVTITSNGQGILDPEGSQTVEYTVTFPQDAGNDYQGATGTLTFTVNANQ